MPLRLEVTNTGDVDLMRLEYLFKAGETRDDVEVSEHYYEQIADHPDLASRIVGMDEVSTTDPVVLKSLNATEAAGERARVLGIGLVGIEGSGKEGTITVKDVESAAEERDAPGTLASSGASAAGPEVPNTERAKGAAGAADPEGPGGDAKATKGYDPEGGSMQGKDLPPDKAPDGPPDPVRDEPKQKGRKD